MIDYPSIEYCYPNVLGRTCVVSEKIDGHNIRAEYAKGEFKKFGSRKMLVGPDSEDRMFARGVRMFHEKYADALKKAMKKLRISKGVVFGELYGAECHIARIDYKVDMAWTFFDIADVEKKQFISARDVVNTFVECEVPTPTFTIEHVDNNLINAVREDRTPGKEGMVFKPQQVRKPSLKLQYAKAKTAWFMERIGEV